MIPAPPSLPAAVLLLTGFLLTAACSGPAPSEAETQNPGRPPAAGRLEGVVNMNSISLQFVEYRNDAAELARRVDRMLAEAPSPDRKEAPAALVVPHAGYRYSGPIAACAYRALQGLSYDTVVIIGLSHRVRFRGISVLDAPAFESPLGTIPTDRELTAALLEADDGIAYLPEAHAEEHSLEVQIPFLQRTLGDFKLVMAAIHDHDPAAEEALVGTLVEAARSRRILLVASTDFSHYHPYDLANHMDRRALRSVLALDGAALSDDIRAGKAELCGIRPVLTVMEAVRRMGAHSGVLLRQANSGDTAGDRERVVGYAAIAFYAGDDEEGGEAGERAGPSGLDRASRKELLAIARGAIEGAVRDGHPPEPASGNPVLQEPRGAFVTIKIDGRLRGCIGNFGIRNARALYRTVSEMAAAAAIQDPRFPPLREEELPRIEVEISALSPLRPVDDVGEIEVGRHGIYITKGFRSGVLLPQVATEYGWDRETFLEQTGRKAGLGPGEWKEGSTISVFEAEVFGESDRADSSQKNPGL